MRHLTPGRRMYWALVVLKTGIVVANELEPQFFAVLRRFDAAIVLVPAGVVVVRFADTGWPRWLGITSVLVVSVLLPIGLIFASLPRPAVGTSNPIDPVPDLAWISTVLLAVLLIFADVEPSASGVADGRGGGERDVAKEPSFP